MAPPSDLAAFDVTEWTPLLSGADLLEAMVSGYTRHDKTAHEAALVRDCLDRFGRQWGIDLVSELAAVLFFDAWIGNGDRHPENWGLIASPLGYRLAPIYDVAGCLGAELTGDHRLLADRASQEELELYASRCPSGFGDGKRRIDQATLVADLRRWPEWTAHSGWWLDCCDAIYHDSFGALLGAIPDDWLPPWRKRFASRLLEVRLEWLGKTR